MPGSTRVNVVVAMVASTRVGVAVAVMVGFTQVDVVLLLMEVGSNGGDVVLAGTRENLVAATVGSSRVD